MYLCIYVFMYLCIYVFMYLCIYVQEEYDADLPLIEELLKPLILKCKEKNRALRIGTNHGSLSARVMSFWGDSPRGMVESALEFANICRKHDFHNFLFSMKVRLTGDGDGGRWTGICCRTVCVLLCTPRVYCVLLIAIRHSHKQSRIFHRHHHHHHPV